MVRKSLHPGDWRREQPVTEEIVEEIVEEVVEEIVEEVVEEEVTVFNPEAAATDGDPFPETEPEEEETVDYNSMTVAMLRDLLDERGLAVSGIKAELVARLEEDDAGLSEESETPAEPEEAPSEEVVPSEEEVSEYGGTEQDPEN